MAFLRYANAIVVHPNASPKGWTKIRTARVAGNPSNSLVAQATEILGKPLNPSTHLLSHCSIVASVDIEAVPGVKIGSVMDGGERINRTSSKYRITSETEQYTNNNNDSFPREVLLKSYRTFIGAQNFLEHCQVADLSKGRIIDAVARDIGNSIYIDILVATDRAHKELVADIESGRMSTLSMGASVENTTCTKCGNVAVDETEMCSHIKNAKGSYFQDERGQTRKIAELCGQESLEPHGGVQFVEASWVASPAFTGAVLRNIITPSSLSESLSRQAQVLLASPPPEWIVGAMKSAQLVNPVTEVNAAFDFGDGENGDGGDAGTDEGSTGDAGTEEAPAAPEAPPKPTQFDDLEDRVMKNVMDHVEKRLTEDMDKNKPPIPPSTAPNDSIIKQAQLKTAQQAYTASVRTMIQVATSDIDLINKIASLDSQYGLAYGIGKEIYRAALLTGAISTYESSTKYLNTCRGVLGRLSNDTETTTLLRLGHILNRLVSTQPQPPQSTSKKSPTGAKQS